MVWRTFWQHSVALSRCQCALLRDCACWCSGGFLTWSRLSNARICLLPANHSGGRLPGQNTSTTVPCRSRKTSRHSRISAGRMWLFTGVCSSPRVLRCTDGKGCTSPEAGCCCLEELDSNRSVADCFGAGELSVLWEWKLARQCLRWFWCAQWR